ncbi:MAG: hypothetical protein AABX25_04655 [Nanoarchaeota archaeon]
MYQTLNYEYSGKQQSSYHPIIAAAVLVGLGAGLALLLKGDSHGGGHKATHQPAHKDLESQL